MTGEPIIVCPPVDREIRARLISMAESQGMTLPEPSTEHSLTTCHQCGLDVWIGPRQRAMADRFGVSVVCYLCAIAMASPSATAIHLGGNDGIPRT